MAAKAKRTSKRGTPARRASRSQGSETLLTRRNAILAWLAGFAFLVAIAFWPPSYDMTRRSTIFLVVFLLGGLLAILWRYWVLRWPLIFLYVVVGTFLLLPGRTNYDRPHLRAETAKALRRYMGVKYHWGGENQLGIDCSGIVRRGAVDALFLEGFRSLNPYLVRKGLTLWWNDLSAKEMGRGARGEARRLMKAPSIREADHAILYPGDIAITQGGFHALAYLGNSLWIQADPGSEKVVIVDARSSTNPWLLTPVTFLRWKYLFVPRPQPR